MFLKFLCCFFFILDTIVKVYVTERTNRIYSQYNCRTHNKNLSMHTVKGFEKQFLGFKLLHIITFWIFTKKKWSLYMQ